MPNEPKRRPGDRILDRYCPNLTPEERELAHQRLRNLARVLIRIAKRQAEEALQADSRESPEGGTIRPTPNI
jgi:hypothetical protein